MSTITRVWYVCEEEDSSASTTAISTVNICRTSEEADAYVRQHQRLGRHTQRPLLFVYGPWHQYPSGGCAPIDGETHTSYPTHGGAVA